MDVRSEIHHEPDVHYHKSESFQTDQEKHFSGVGDVSVSYDEECIRSLVNNMYALSRLETLYVHFSCIDDVLRAAGKWCRKLKHLDITGSRQVSDRSVEDILKVLYLEELNVAGTSVSENGYTELIPGLSQNKTQRGMKQSHALTSFGCDCYSTCHLSFIVREFINLTEVNLIVRDCNVSVLRTLDSLRMLIIKCGGFSGVEELLLEKGEQLVDLKLDLDFNVSVDLTFVVEKCPNLKSLTVLGDTCVNYSVECKVYPTIKHLTLQTRNCSAAAHLLSQCHNLTVLELCAASRFFDYFMVSMFAKKPLTHLKELTVGSPTNNMTSETLGLITEHCTNLTVLKIFGPSKVKGVVYVTSIQAHGGHQIPVGSYQTLKSRFGFPCT
jgi:hypothetical protein